MKIRNKYFYNTDQSILVTLREEYAMLGYDTSLERGVLIVFARKRKKSKKDKEKAERDKRREKFQRRDDKS